MTTAVNDTSVFPCGPDPPYYTHILGITVDWILLVIGLPAVCLASYALFRLAKAGQVAPIYVINLLISDLIQIAITFIFILSRFCDSTFQPMVTARCLARIFVRLGLCTSLGFMVLISLERYMVVACPVWYRFRRSVKNSILISLSLWAMSLGYVTFDYTFLIHNSNQSLTVFSGLSLLPAPFLVLGFVVTQRALHRGMALRGPKRMKILGTMGLVLGIYIFLFIPFSIRNLYFSLMDSNPSVPDPVRDMSSVITSALMYLSPLTDCCIYIFMRTDLRDTIVAFPCCRRLLSGMECERSIGEIGQEDTQSVDQV
ncbi:G-protein coupled receptor 4-like [Esox lucius]|uniref:G-protein coupled receptors family 1 profile domain-containing protein n=1 Tax=Esox lucius TaxID=8010 RepID=A0AAY5KTV7_ESOLU|nr:G-protein coupled receptor 4-like [Esox lucius]